MITNHIIFFLATLRQFCPVDLIIPKNRKITPQRLKITLLPEKFLPPINSSLQGRLGISQQRLLFLRQFVKLFVCRFFFSIVQHIFQLPIIIMIRCQSYLNHTTEYSAFLGFIEKSIYPVRPHSRQLIIKRSFITAFSFLQRNHQLPFGKCNTDQSIFSRLSFFIHHSIFQPKRKNRQ